MGTLFDRLRRLLGITPAVSQDVPAGTRGRLLVLHEPEQVEHARSLVAALKQAGFAVVSEEHQADTLQKPRHYSVSAVVLVRARVIMAYQLVRQKTVNSATGERIPLITVAFNEAGASGEDDERTESEWVLTSQFDSTPYVSASTLDDIAGWVSRLMAKWAEQGEAALRPHVSAEAQAQRQRESDGLIDVVGASSAEQSPVVPTTPPTGYAPPPAPPAQPPAAESAESTTERKARRRQTASREAPAGEEKIVRKRDDRRDVGDIREDRTDQWRARDSRRDVGGRRREGLVPGGGTDPAPALQRKERKKPEAVPPPAESPQDVAPAPDDKEAPQEPETGMGTAKDVDGGRGAPEVAEAPVGDLFSYWDPDESVEDGMDAPEDAKEVASPEAAEPVTAGPPPAKPQVAEAEADAEKTQPKKPARAEEVQFTVFHPKEVPALNWQTLVAYAHLPGVLTRVREDVERFGDEMPGEPREVFARGTSRLVRGTELRFVPAAPGVTFKPEQVTLSWDEDFERAQFRFRGEKTLINQPCFGTLLVYVGPLEVASVSFSVFFTDPVAAMRVTQPLKEPPKHQTSTTSMYKQVFASYSHRDTFVVHRVEAALTAIGYDLLADYKNLRSGEVWDQALERLIDRADIFQLFWSEHSASSRYVENEWRYALQIHQDQPGGPGATFIRPVYWQQPLPGIPAALQHLHFKYMPELGEST